MQVKDLARLSLRDPEYVAVHADAEAPTPLKLRQVAPDPNSACGDQNEADQGRCSAAVHCRSMSGAVGRPNSTLGRWMAS